MPHTFILDVPVKLSLELMTTVRADGVNAEGELLDHVVDERNGIFLVMAIVDPQGPDSGGIVNGRVLVSSDSLVLCGFQAQKLDIHLDMVARNLLGIPAGVNRSPVRILWQTS